MSSAQAEELRQKLTENLNSNIADVIERNIGIIELLKREQLQRRSLQDKIADSITAFSGSMIFVYLHGAWFIAWVVINEVGIAGIKPFDPYPFGLLTMIVSLEAIFLSTFVMLSQNRMGAIGDEQRALDLQIDLLAEYEITRMLRLVDKIAEKMGIEDSYDEEIDQLCEPIAPDVVVREINKRAEYPGHG